MIPANKTYRLCRFDGALHDVSADWIEATSDEEAIAKAGSADGTRWELWDGRRLVASWTQPRPERQSANDGGADPSVAIG